MPIIAILGICACKKDDSPENELASIGQQLVGKWVSDESCEGCYELLIGDMEMTLSYAPTISVEPETMVYELKDGNTIQTYRKWYGHEMAYIEHDFTFGEDESLTIDRFVLTLVGFGSATFVRAETSNN